MQELDAPAEAVIMGEWKGVPVVVTGVKTGGDLAVVWEAACGLVEQLRLGAHGGLLVDIPSARVSWAEFHHGDDLTDPQGEEGTITETNERKEEE